MDGKWVDGHFVIGDRTACGIKRACVNPTSGKCGECLAMLTCTMNWQDGEDLLQEGWYSSGNGYASVVVAVVRPGVDWAAFIGGCSYTKLEEEAVRWTAIYGVKLPLCHAHHFFPNLPRRMYRA